MANTIQHKRSSTATTIPTSGQLAAGELAVNTADGKLYLKKDNASVVQIGGPAEAGTLTGATLASNVLASSLTSVGTLTAVNTSGVITGTNTTASTSSTTGALIIAGGAGFAKDININGANAGIGAGTNNTKFGKDAHSQMALGGDSCTAVGYQAGFWNSTGDGNSGFGANALLNTRAGSWNSGLGINALLTNQTGSHNVACGLEALYSAVGDFNTGIGSNSGYHLAGASTNNICIGYNAGKFHSNGTTALTASSNSCYLGTGSRGLNNSDSNSIVIGSSAIGLGANTTVIGTSSTTSAKIWGAVTAAGTLTTDAYILSSSGIQAKTASYTLVAADNGKVITMSVATANTLTVPASLDVGFNCTIIQIGAGQTTITASGTTLNSVSAFLKISAQHGSASIISYASNVYNVAGSLSA